MYILYILLKTSYYTFGFTFGAVSFEKKSYDT